MKNKNVMRVCAIVVCATAITCSAVPTGTREELNNETDVVAAQEDLTTTQPTSVYAGVSTVLYDNLDDIVVTEDNETNVLCASLEDTYDKSEVETIEEVTEEVLIGYVSSESGVNVRTAPSKDSEIIDVYAFNTEVEYSVYNENWLKLYYNDEVAYINAKFISDEITVLPYTEKSTPSHNSFKSYMDAKFITNKSSTQYKLKQKASIDQTTGFYVYEGRYLIAVGSFYTTSVGTKIDLIMENGEVVECILGDCKSDKHTDTATHRQNPNGSIAEFVVKTSALPKKARQMGDASYALDELRGEIKAIRVYE